MKFIRALGVLVFALVFALAGTALLDGALVIADNTLAVIGAALFALALLLGVGITRRMA